VLQPNADGVYELELRPTEFTVEGKRHCARAYNGMYPAPTIDTAAQSGGQPRHVRVNLRNRFTKMEHHSLLDETCTCADTTSGASCMPSHEHTDPSCVCTNEKGEMCHLFDFNTTNLHAHGSHVRPDYATGGGCVEKDGLQCRTCNGDRSTGAHECFFADDVIARVGPGEGIQARWDVDEDGVHHAGLDWYHPHIHGSTAIQVAGGATGAWIVRGPLDEIPGIKNAKERILLITTPPTTYTPLADGEPCDEDHLTFDDFPTLNATSGGQETNLINGIRRPRIVVPPGQIERWRFLHGAFLDEIPSRCSRGRTPTARISISRRARCRSCRSAATDSPCPAPPTAPSGPSRPTTSSWRPGIAWRRSSTAAR
jgi:FtsP/CotA-like multicopper oxidase with cupredoxin domain